MTYSRRRASSSASPTSRIIAPTRLGYGWSSRTDGELSLSEAEILLGLGTIIVFGVVAQVIAARLAIPGVLVLLTAGVIAGPITGLVVPDELFGELLFPGVTLAVGLLLFDGGLQLQMHRIRAWRGVVTRLVTVGVLVTWIVGSLTIDLVTDLDGGTAWLLGAVLVVSGPTVVIPLLRRFNPKEPSGEILEWEGILIDPVGAMLGVIMLDVVLDGDTAVDAAGSIAATVAAGVGAGVVGAMLTIAILRMPQLPQLLRAPVALALAVAAYSVANLLVPEAGLFATTTVGIFLANQTKTPIEDIAAFEEGVGVLALGSLFIVLGARMPIDALADTLVPGLVLLAVLVLVARPLAVFVSTIGTGLDRPSSLFVASLAPRGIVAAATASVFALELQAEGIPGSDTLTSITFIVIIGAGLIYGLGAGPMGKRLGVVQATSAAAPATTPRQPTN